MKIFDKIKDALFEEEYVEVDVKPKKKSPKKEKRSVMDILKDKTKEEKPIAKKVIFPNKKSASNSESIAEEEVEASDNENVEEDNILDSTDSFKVIEDDDLVVEENYAVPEPQIVKVINDEAWPTSSWSNSENIYYRKTQDRPKQPYGIDESTRISVHEYGSYEKKEESGYFKPSPIISPIYGILDKNYKKEDIGPKKELRLTSSYARERMNVDEVRRKAYGNLSDDIASSLEEEKTSPKFEVEEKEEDSNLLFDLSSEEEKPTVKEVTVGDALEYFEDLGLEYNVDYVDATQKKPKKLINEEPPVELDTKVDSFEVKLVTKGEDEEVKEESNTEESVEPVKETRSRVKEHATVEEDDDNLFDLIDSMYQEEE